jgi:hypothetical protein
MDTKGLQVPDFFIVGQPKSGTTALYNMLRKHPQIYMPDLKEPGYLAHDLWPRFDHPRAPAKPKTMDEYLHLFTSASHGQKLGEASAIYLFSHEAAAAIASLNPAARIIAIFREPASFLRSTHLEFRQVGSENQRSLRKAIALEDQRRQGRHVPRKARRPQLLQYSDLVRYTEQLRRYHEVLPREQVLSLIYDDYRGDNQATVQQVFAFLGVDQSVPVETEDANPSFDVRSQQLLDAVHKVTFGRTALSRQLKGGVNAVVPPSVRRRVLQGVESHFVFASPGPADDELMAELRVWLKPEVERFSAYSDRDLLTLWQYDRL